MIRAVLYFSISVFALGVLSSCGKGPQIKALSATATILAFGDSLTYGTGGGKGHDYPSVLGKRLNRKVINAGVPGEVSSTGLSRFKRVLERVQPDLVILCHGGNDILKRNSFSDIKANLKSMITFAQASGVDVILIAVPKMGLSLESAPFYEELADEMNVPCENKVLASILSDSSLKSDVIHPNTKGYAVFADKIASLIYEAQE